ncbi:DUF2628 domain-containing protein [Aurantimonas aggregata]|uniref:DUF2628 domain-containing protein n=1 Tax=Aurantimonas aggregata TaxID=2047720 RepID=A0A6L9ML79_9HYPH|nr:DUF2628 domain-containing protein [Aurantimonas aggregata]NDV88412.1 DUF2628 domain-containing protein [Aurantimonas aggregata]
MALTRYIVFEPPASSGTTDRAVFVRDRFSVWALLVPFLWLLRYGLWISAVVVLVAGFGLAWLGSVEGFGLAGTVLPILLGLIVALEGPSLRAAKYRRKGWRETAAFHADDRAEAELIYYGTSRPAIAAPAPVLAQAPWKTAPRAPRPAATGGFFDAMKAR